MPLLTAKAALWAWLLTALLAAPLEGDDASDLATEAKDETTLPYTAPRISGLHWVETFDGDVFSRWKSSTNEKYNGRFKAEKRKQETLLGDVGLLVPEEARHYGAAVSFPPLEGKKDASFVAQFEVRFQEGLSCGGAYLKLFNSEGREASEFSSDTRYVIMFGPDRCGATDKVHFILQHQNPKSQKWEEKHFKEPPTVPNDQLTHLYSLIVNPDNSFEIQIDGQQKASGNLLTSMQPSINPPKEIDDPKDSKPADWVDEEKINDPLASKPEDWDEDAPATIPDPKASMPDGWNEDAQKKIPDPNAKMPADWDADEDGEWEPPVIDNPACKVGCGKWVPPKISNPEYKGKWVPPKVDNPAYKGIWKARQIDNPHYFVDEAPGLLPKIDSVGIDIWTMQKGLIFDNLLISTDLGTARQFAEKSFFLRKPLEEKQQPKPPKKDGLLDRAIDFVMANPIPTATTLVILLLTTLWCCCRGGDSPPGPSSAELMERRRLREEREQARRLAEQSAADSQDAPAEETSASSVPKEEGGLGDISSDS